MENWDFQKAVLQNIAAAKHTAFKYNDERLFVVETLAHILLDSTTMFDEHSPYAAAIRPGDCGLVVNRHIPDNLTASPATIIHGRIIEIVDSMLDKTMPIRYNMWQNPNIQAHMGEFRLPTETEMLSSPVLAPKNGWISPVLGQYLRLAAKNAITAAYDETKERFDRRGVPYGLAKPSGYTIRGDLFHPSPNWLTRLADEKIIPEEPLDLTDQEWMGLIALFKELDIPIIQTYPLFRNTKMEIRAAAEIILKR